MSRLASIADRAKREPAPKASDFPFYKMRDETILAKRAAMIFCTGVY